MIETSLVLRSIGYRGVPIPGLPFDESTGTVPHIRGRVTDARPRTKFVTVEEMLSTVQHSRGETWMTATSITTSQLNRQMATS